MIQAYSFTEKKLVKIVAKPVMKQYFLKNGNTVTILIGESKKGDKVAVIIANQKEKKCKNGKPRTKVGARCPRK